MANTGFENDNLILDSGIIDQNESVAGGAIDRFGAQHDMTIASGTQTDQTVGASSRAIIEGSSIFSGAFDSGMIFAGVAGNAQCKSTGTMTHAIGTVGIVQSVTATTLGTLTYGMGVAGEILHTIPGTITEGAGVYGRIINSSTGTITDASCLVAEAVTNSGGGTLTNAYGLRVKSISGGTNNWSIYTNTGLASFGDDVEIRAANELRFADADSSKYVSFKSAATVADNVVWTLPSADGTSGQALSTNGSGTLSWTTVGAPVGAQYVVIALDATLTAERVLTGTANQITVTDGGAGGNVTLSTPQDIATSSSPTFAGLTVNGVETITVNDATTNGISTVFVVQHATTGTAANNIGTGIRFDAEQDQGTMVNGGLIGVILTDADSTPSSAMVFQTRSAGGALTEQLRIGATGTLTCQGEQIIDVTHLEALLVRKNADAGDVFIVDTTNSVVGVNMTPTGTAGAGAMEIAIADAVTNASTVALRLWHNTSGTSAAGYGTGLQFVGEISSGAAFAIAQIDATMPDAVSPADGQLQFLTRTQSGSLTVNMTIGPTGNLTLPNGDVIASKKIIFDGTTTTSGAGAVAVTGSIHEITTTGTGDALTLADGTEGQTLRVVYVAEGAGADTAVLTPTNLAGTPTTITFNAIGDAVTLLFTASTWFVVGINGAVVA